MEDRCAACGELFQDHTSFGIRKPFAQKYQCYGQKDKYIPRVHQFFGGDSVRAEIVTDVDNQKVISAKFTLRKKPKEQIDLLNPVNWKEEMLRLFHHTDNGAIGIAILIDKLLAAERERCATMLENKAKARIAVCLNARGKVKIEDIATITQWIMEKTADQIRGNKIKADELPF